MAPPQNTIFREQQKFNQPWLWGMLLTAMTLTIGLGLNTFFTTGAIFPTLLATSGVALAAIFIASLTLKTTVTTEGISISFHPFGRQRVFRSEIKRAYVRKYSPLGEFGGWGVRSGDEGKAYNVRGDQGLQLELKNGERILIGTQEPEELAAAINDYLDPVEEPTLHLDELPAGAGRSINSAHSSKVKNLNKR